MIERTRWGRHGMMDGRQSYRGLLIGKAGVLICD